MTPKQQRRQSHRENGKYAKVNPCYVCEKSAGLDYCSHPDTDVSIGDELLCLCDSCYAELCEIPGPQAVAKSLKRTP